MRERTTYTVLLVIATAILLWPALSWAQAPPLLPVQGVLFDADGVPVDGSVIMTFAIYDDDARTSVLHSETVEVDVSDGFFTVNLGESIGLDLATFSANESAYLGVTVADDTEMPLVEIATTAYSAYAEFAGDAETVAGLDASGLRTFDPCSEGSAVRVINADGTVSCEEVSGTDDAGDLTTGTLSTARYSAYDDLTAEERLDDAGDTDLLTRAQAQAHFVDEDQADSVDGAMIEEDAIRWHHLYDGCSGGFCIDPPPTDTLPAHFVDEGQANSITSAMIAAGEVGRGDVNAEFRDCDTGNDLCERSELDTRYVEENEDNSVDGNMVADGTLTVDDLNVADRNCNGTTDLCPRGEIQDQFVEEGETNSITTGMIVNGTITQDDIHTTNPGSIYTSCGRFIPVEICPFGSDNGDYQVGCADVLIGSFCEADADDDCFLRDSDTGSINTNVEPLVYVNPPTNTIQFDNCGEAEWFYKVDN